MLQDCLVAVVTCIPLSAPLSSCLCLCILYFLISTRQKCQTKWKEPRQRSRFFKQDRPLFYKRLTVNQSTCLSFQVLTIFSHSTLVNHCSLFSSSGCLSTSLQKQFPLFTICKSNFAFSLHWKSLDRPSKWQDKDPCFEIWVRMSFELPK